MSRFEIVPMGNDTVRQVADIEAECFTSPWSYEAFFRELSNPNARTWVAVSEDGTAVGFLNAYFVLDEASLNNIAVSAAWRRQGIGRALIETAIGYCRQNGMVSFILEVRKSNLPAITLYEKLGFRKVGERRNFYTLPDEDALLMTKKL